MSKISSSPCPEKYDFSPQQFSGLVLAMDMDQVSKAENLTRLCLQIFPEEIKIYTKEETEAYIKKLS